MHKETADLAKMKGLDAKDIKMLKEADQMLGSEPSEMGHIKNIFWGNFRQDLVFPYPESATNEVAKCNDLLEKLETYLKTEHPAVQIDQEEEIPQWVFDKLFGLGVMGLTIPTEYGGLGLGVSSYNRVLQLIGKYCASTAVIVSAHQSIGCKAIVLFGTEEQKKKWLPMLATKYLSAFGLSEPNVGCDAGGQETHCELSEDGTHYLLNGEKKWNTSGYYSKVFTVMAKQKIKGPDGTVKESVTALVCTPDLAGIDIYQKNRSKCGIRGTWQARVRFKDVKVPKENLLHNEGKGLNVALTCLNYGRCTLSAGMLGSAQRCTDQAVKWARTRHQFDRPLADFELMKKLIAEMASFNYAMDSVLYMTTGMMDRHDKDIMIETAACKVFCSEMGWRVINHAVQIMGGEGYMTENEMERAFRDSRIYLIVEGANEVMQSYIFGYGGKQLAEHLVGLQNALMWNSDESMGQNFSRLFSNLFHFRRMKTAISLAMELFAGIKKTAPLINQLHPSLHQHAEKLSYLIQNHSYHFKLVSLEHKEKIVTRQVAQARLADCAIYLHAMACCLSKHDMEIRKLKDDATLKRHRSYLDFFMSYATKEIEKLFISHYDHSDDSMRLAAEEMISYNDNLPNKEFIIPERSPSAMGTGRTPKQDYIKQFPGDNA